MNPADWGLELTPAEKRRLAVTEYLAKIYGRHPTTKEFERYLYVKAALASLEGALKTEPPTKSPPQESAQTSAGSPGRPVDNEKRDAFRYAEQLIRQSWNKTEAARMAIEIYYPDANEDRKGQLTDSLRDTLKPSKRPKWADE